MYLYLSNQLSAQYPENTAADFTVQLPTTISGVKECGVVEIKLAVAPPKPLFLCSDLCEESIINSKTLPVLRRVAQKTFVPSIITYVPLRLQSFDTLRLYIRKESGEQANITGETRVTLHLR
jgi:hypothetical protein